MRRRMRHPGRGQLPAVRTGSASGFDTRTMTLQYLRRLLPSLELNDDFFDALFAVLPPEQFRKLSRETVRLWLDAPERNRMDSRVDREDLLQTRQYGRAVESLLACGALRGGEGALRSLVERIIGKALSGAPDPVEAFTKQLAELREVYRISGQELEGLLFFYTMEEQQHFSRLFQDCNIAGLVEVTATALGVGGAAARDLLSSRGRLVTNGLVEEGSMRRSADFPDLDTGIREFLGGLVNGGLRERFVRRDTGSRYPLAGFHVPEDSLVVLQGLLRRKGPAQVLLYGRPGTGKTELARALAASIGKVAFFFAGDDEESRRSAHRAGLVAAADRVVKEDAVLIMDEADRFLETEAFSFFLFSGASPEEKGKEWLNNFLDSTQARIIWITNKTGRMADSVKRRFDFSLKFRDFDRRQRLAMWRIQARRHKIRLPERELARLAAEYPVNAGTIATALKGAAVLGGAANAEMLPRLQEILSRQLELAGMVRLPDRTATCRGYDAAALALDTDRGALETSLRGFAAHLERLPASETASMNCLFWGPSGTGKTEYARHLAGLLHKELVFKRASDLLDPYVGMTEKRIREAFAEASSQDAILFIDEADSFLRTREKASRSWELSFVNEFLTNMESFRGILVCCTNLREELDSASLRRFQWKVGFQALDGQGRERLFRRYFQPRGKLARPIAERLARLEGLVPGDYRAVELRLGFLPPEERAATLILDELGKELELRVGKRELVGFSAGKGT